MKGMHTHDRTAFVTGAASGIGLGLATALGQRGAKVMLADIDSDKLALAVSALAEHGIDADWVACDVSKPDEVKAAADATVDRFGNVHILANNAGVSLGGATGEIAIEDWRWIVNVNLMGVVYGVEEFVPRMTAHGEGAHIINTASMAGHWATPLLGPYNATKYAVVGYSETLRDELAGSVGVSVLCPAWVRTGIATAHDRRPSASGMTNGASDAVSSMIGGLVDSGLDPADVGEWIVDSIEADRFYIFTHPDMRWIIDARRDRIQADYEACVADGRFGVG